MKALLFLVSLTLTAQLFAQDTAKVKIKEWLGVLSLTEKYKEEKNWTQVDQAIVGEHFQRLIAKKNEGVIVLAGRTDLPTDSPDMMGLVIFYAKDEKEALQFMMNDPAVKNNIMKAKVYPYGIAVSACK